MKIKIDRLFMAIGVFLLLSSAILLLYNLREDKTAGDRATEILRQVKVQIPEFEPYEINAAEKTASIAVGEHSYTGILDIPALDLSLPVMTDWSYSNLRLAPCRYEGSASDGSLIVVAHNYNSHFGALKSLSQGDRVVYTDVDGSVYYYKVSDLETLDGNAAKEMSDGDWDLTLFTCTLSGLRRITVRCVLA